MSAVIQPPGRRGSAQPSTTGPKTRSAVTVNRRALRRRLRLARKPSSGTTPRGSGLNQAGPGRPSTGIGKIPLR